jgi:WhiB family transcriptional regulator, redox-sensing transcriptional regulator
MGPEGFITGTAPWSSDPVDLAEIIHPPAWHADAACREHPDVSFFPKLGEDVRPAKRVCHTCLVAADCRAWALAQGVTLVGVWGGTTQRERRMIRHEKFPKVS